MRRVAGAVLNTLVMARAVHATRSDRLRTIAATLAVDLVTAQVVQALDRAGHEAILLKGPSLAAWLYTDGTPRPYGDTDLLIDASRAKDVHDVLADLGFRHGGVSTVGEEALGTMPWVRGTAAIDLHVTLGGMAADPAEVWSALRPVTVPFVVAGQPVLAPAPAAQCLVVALHAAHHGSGERRPLEDLRRALAHADASTWRAAAHLATHTLALPAFASGLRMLEHGRRLADDLGLSHAESVELALQSRGQMSVAFGFEELARRRGSDRLRFLAHEILPPPVWMRAKYPAARRGRAALAAAHARRWTWLAVRLGPGWSKWKRARREARK